MCVFDHESPHKTNRFICEVMIHSYNPISFPKCYRIRRHKWAYILLGNTVLFVTMRIVYKQKVPLYEKVNEHVGNQMG